ncbi:unnamed protein product [Urochloa decumbens]|uniref:F-box domain-containing protein n=1 Tax=Urochloa decumbens TaxID=240449 RepID=A0ABC8YJN4_9POAL
MESPPAGPLPADVLADVLARLAPRSLAASRCVCREWRAVADACCPPLRADLLPITLGGMFIVTSEPDEAPPQFFARPSMARKIAGGRLETYVKMERYDTPADIEGSCNGLLLLDELVVVNPATRQWARLPPRPASPEGGADGFDYVYLVFDPTVSPHYEVISMKNPLDYCKGNKVSTEEWPPSVYVMRVYSSETRRWEERPFVREGPPLEITVDVRATLGHAAYWHEALYVHCTTDFVMRITLSNDKYQAIKFPEGIDGSNYYELYLGKSKSGVYLALVDNQHQLQVWFLEEFGVKIEWVLKRIIHLRAMVAHFIKNPAQTDTSWIISRDHNCDQENNEGPTGEKTLDWDSDDDNAVEVQVPDPNCFYGYNQIFGFHPYKETVFLYLSSSRVVAYHFNSSKIQELGKLRMKNHNQMVDTTFIYSPCWIDELSENC